MLLGKELQTLPSTRLATRGSLEGQPHRGPPLRSENLGEETASGPDLPPAWSHPLAGNGGSEACAGRSDARPVLGATCPPAHFWSGSSLGLAILRLRTLCAQT